MDKKVKERIQEIDNEIEKLLAEKQRLNPFASLKSLSWKEFGEGFSEQYVLDHVPHLSKENGAGHDMYSKRLGYIEVKSGRLPYKSGWTMNQLHPSECDYFLFVFYDTEEADTYLYLVPCGELTDSNKFTLSRQHGEGCFSLGQTKKNQDSLEEYRIKDWQELDSLV